MILLPLLPGLRVSRSLRQLSDRAVKKASRHRSEVSNDCQDGITRIDSVSVLVRAATCAPKRGRLNDLGEIQIRKEELESFSSIVADVDAHRDALLRINGLVCHETKIPDEDEPGPLVRGPVRRVQ